MNSFRYLVSRMGLYFGFHPKTKHLSEAADEMHLLRQAEEILGEDTWEQAEDIEELSVEYWTLRKLNSKKNTLAEEAHKAGLLLNASQGERNTAVTETNKVYQALQNKRDLLINSSEDLIAKLNEIMAEAKRVKRKFDASSTKIQVLTGEPDTEDIIKGEIKKKADCKMEFVLLKKERKEVAASIDDLDEKITQVELAIAADRKRLRDEASSAYQSIGKVNQDMSRVTAEIGLIDIEMKVHFARIGRYFSIRAEVDPACAKICKEYSTLCSQMQGLRSSIALNNKLAIMAEN